MPCGGPAFCYGYIIIEIIQGFYRNTPAEGDIVYRTSTDISQTKACPLLICKEIPGRRGVPNEGFSGGQLLLFGMRQKMIRRGSRSCQALPTCGARTPFLRVYLPRNGSTCSILMQTFDFMCKTYTSIAVHRIAGPGARGRGVLACISASATKCQQLRGPL